MTSVQSWTASARLLNSSARASSGAAPTAERASRKANSYAFTTRRWKKPKLLTARAAAPILSGLRGATRMTRRRSDSALGNTGDKFTAGKKQGDSAGPGVACVGGEG